MEVGYVVLYVKDTEACRRFWPDQVGEHQGTPSFAFADPDGRWFAVTR